MIKSFSSLSGDKRFLLSVRMSPAVLKTQRLIIEQTHSLGVVVGVTDRYRLRVTDINVHQET